MKTIPQTFQKNGYDYTLVTRRGMTAIYEQRAAGRIAAYEVHRIKIVKPATVHGKSFEGGETLPTTQEWGKNGWTFSTFGGSVAPEVALAQAEDRMALVEGARLERLTR
jgi:hypothetical protein